MEQIGVIDQKRMGGFVMPTRSTGAGLCLTCNNVDTCVYRKRRGADAISCELFDNYVTRNGGGGKEATLAVLTPAKESEPASRKGLCLNCSHQKACQLPKPETGVWHCEEYE